MANKTRELIPVAFVAVLFAMVTTARLKATRLCTKPSRGLTAFVVVGASVGVVADVVCCVGHGFGFRLKLNYWVTLASTANVPAMPITIAASVMTGATVAALIE